MQIHQHEMQNAGGHAEAGLNHAAEASADHGAGNMLERMRRISFEFGPGLKDILNFTSQLAVMLKAGINIRSAIGAIAEQVENTKFQRIMYQVKSEVESGQPLSEALAKHPKIFGPLYVNMVRAAELSGSLGQMLERIGKYLRQQLETRNMVRGAMVYPAIIGVMAVGTTIFLLTFVLPRFTTLFAGKSALLPKPTLVLMTISAFLRNFWYVVLALFAMGICGFCYAIRTPVGRWYWDKFKLRLPLFRRMFRALYITRGLHTMGELINAGVPVLETLTITADVSGNVIYRRMWRNVYTSVKQGEKIADGLGREALLPKHVVQMISSGEESGKLGKVLRDISEYYAGELRNTIKSVTAMIEPLMIVLMGLIVGFIAMSIILPIFKMSSLVK
ncbi:MAG: type II secretion system F family protein [Planctomycetota bacterium]|nr:type II secretion system F family protein [Planctomycetota bacterium]